MSRIRSDPDIDTIIKNLKATKNIDLSYKIELIKNERYLTLFYNKKSFQIHLRNNYKLNELSKKIKDIIDKNGTDNPGPGIYL